MNLKNNTHLIKNSFCIFLVFILNDCFAQIKTPRDCGYTHLTTIYKGDTVDILIWSKAGEELKPKPLFLFCQGSLPKPLLMVDANGNSPAFPFRTETFETDFHIAIIGKPGIPAVCEFSKLQSDYTYVDSTGKFPEKYIQNNLPDYYVQRNIAVIKFLQKQSWVTKEKLIVAGHSEGSTVAAQMAASFKGITHLIYAGGNPMGRIMSIVSQRRAEETDTDSTRFGEKDFEYWQKVVDNKTSMEGWPGDTYKATYDFSKPSFDLLRKLKIPVLVCYGSKDWSTPFNDYLRADFIRQNKTNFTFKAYIGTEHNFFPLDKDGRPDYNTYNWNKVGEDWKSWIKDN
ncbi:MAG: dienelactone hydrolase family protein [Chitinophagaceae bacterium]|nr:dienelactone hydrolase family protein [Chitinophagaceae bacterium]